MNIIKNAGPSNEKVYRSSFDIQYKAQRCTPDGASLDAARFASNSAMEAHAAAPSAPADTVSRPAADR